MEPNVRHVDGLLHLRYRLPHQINCSAVYPRLSPEGCEVILCGHGRGLTLLWRGGRHSKKNRGSVRSSVRGSVPPRGGERDDPMVIDDESGSDDDLDGTQDYAPIRHRLDLPLGTAIRHIAVLRIPQSSLQDALIQPELLRNNLVVALACGDNTIRVLAYPLAFSWAKQRAQAQDDDQLDDSIENWPGVQLRTVATFPGLSNLPRGISMAISSSNNEEDEDSDNSENEAELWELLIAHHSRQQSGKVHIHKVPLSKSGEAFHRRSPSTLIQTLTLSSPATSIEIMTPVNVKESRVAQILVTFADSPLRVYECDLDETPGSGRWTLSISTGLEPSPEGGFRHKGVAAGRWALGGNAIIVLLSNGEWLLYDISTPKAAGLLYCAIPAKPTISGKVGSVVAPKLPHNSPPDAQQKMTPMSPGTRRARQDALFGGPTDTLDAPASSSGITILLQKRANDTIHDSETVILWMGHSGIVITDLAAYWRSKRNSTKDPFGGGIGTHARSLVPTNLDGEMRTGVSVFAPVESASKFKSRYSDIMIAGELSFTVIAAPLPQQVREAPAAQLQLVPASADASMLTPGDLDVGGLDRMLDIMGGPASNTLLPRRNGQDV